MQDFVQCLKYLQKLLDLSADIILPTQTNNHKINLKSIPVANTADLSKHYFANKTIFVVSNFYLELSTLARVYSAS